MLREMPILVISMCILLILSMLLPLEPLQRLMMPTGMLKAELKAVWKDPEFNSENRAFYYARVLENPTCRWSTWDAIRAGVAPRSDLQPTLQERAWSSPIWFVPED